MSTGKIIQIIGPVVDVEFPEEAKLPAILNALEVKLNYGSRTSIVFEVAKHLGSQRVRAVSLGPTDGLRRDLEVTDTGAPIAVPVGPDVLGRLFNVLGETVDNKPKHEFKKKWPIHRKSPPFTDQSTKTEIFETGIKVIDLIAPMVKGGKVGLFGGA